PRHPGENPAGDNGELRAPADDARRDGGTPPRLQPARERSDRRSLRFLPTSMAPDPEGDPVLHVDAHSLRRCALESCLHGASPLAGLANGAVRFLVARSLIKLLGRRRAGAGRGRGYRLLQSASGRVWSKSNAFRLAVGPRPEVGRASLAKESLVGDETGGGV